MRIVEAHLPVRAPVFDVLRAGVAAHDFVPGGALTRARLHRLPTETGEALVGHVVAAVRALHGVSVDLVEEPGIGPSDSDRHASWWTAFHAYLVRELYPPLSPFQREPVEHLFEPILTGELDMRYEPPWSMAIFRPITCSSTTPALAWRA